MATNQRDVTQGLIPNGGLAIVLVAGAILVGLAALLPLVQSSGSTTTGGAVTQLQQEKQDWQARLQEQEVKVAQLGSLSRIDQQARTRLKMVTPSSVRYISVDAPPPEPHHLPSRFLPQTTQETSTGSSLWDDIVDKLPF